MEKHEKMSGSEFVNTMAELGEKHAKMITETLQTVAKEVTEMTSDEKIEEVHPIFISAGKGAYHGAMKLMMDVNNPMFAVVAMKER